MPVMSMLWGWMHLSSNRSVSRPCLTCCAKALYGLLAPYGVERTYNALRTAGALAKREGVELMLVRRATGQRRFIRASAQVATSIS